VSFFSIALPIIGIAAAVITGGVLGIGHLFDAVLSIEDMAMFGHLRPKPDTRMLRALLQRLADQGFAARAAIADTPGLAHAAARHASQPVSIVPPGAPMPVDFPLEALRLPPDICDALRRLGIRTTGQAASIARGPMARRFGKIIALRLDQAAGTVFEPIVPLAPPAAIQARQAFAEPLLTAEAFASVITRLTATVCTALERAGQGARRLDLLFERVDGSIQAIRAGSARPMRDAAHLGRMLADRLEKVDPGLGVEAMRLLVSAADTLGPEQVAASLFEAPAADLAPLIDRLTNRLGAARVYRVAPAESHMPERTLRRVPPLAAIDTTWPRAVPRPVRLLDPPQQIEALMDQPDDAPVAFTWRRVCHTVRRADGPERLGGEWWRDAADDDAQRDYFQVEDDTGRRFWLFRGKTPDAKSRWFLHGFM
jgi:protein ImuB